MKILIIGSKGFIGQATTKHFKNLDLYNIFEADVHTDYANANYIQIDATNADFHLIFRQNQFDWCINCAGAASVPDSINNPLRDYTLNVLNVAKLLNAIKDESPSCKLIQLSSAAVYGNPTELPIKENSPLCPVSPYGLHKRQAEELCELYYNHYGISSFVLRIFSAFGPGLKKQIVWDLYQKAIRDEKVLLFGTGAETRDFIYIDEIPKIFHLLMTKADKKFDIINIASGNDISIKSLAELFLKNLGLNKPILFNGKQRTGDPNYWKADIGKLKSLGYHSEQSLNSDLNKLSKWLTENA